MELPEFLTASGLVGLLVAGALSSLFFLVQPIWAIVDCVDSKRERDAKLLVTLALVFTWGVGSSLYGLFFATSRNLFRFTIFTLALLVLLSIGGVGACTLGVVRGAEQAQRKAEVQRVELDHAIETFRAPVIELQAVAPFQALHFDDRRGRTRSAAVAEFTLAGAVATSARDVSERVRHVAPAGEALYAITDHAFGAISPASGRLVEIAIDPAMQDEFSWPKGIAYDAASGEIIVMTSHVYTRFFRYDPRRSAWERPSAEHRDLPLVALAASPEDGLLYALERTRGEATLRTLRRFNAEGAMVGELHLDPEIPVHADLDAGFQLHASSGRLVLIVPPAQEDPRGARIFVVDRNSGAVSAAAPRS